MGSGSLDIGRQTWVPAVTYVSPVSLLEYVADHFGYQIPKGAAIHPTVEEMCNAGILRPDQRPKIGGDP